MYINISWLVLMADNWTSIANLNGICTIKINVICFPKSNIHQCSNFTSYRTVCCFCVMIHQYIYIIHHCNSNKRPTLIDWNILGRY